MQESRLNERLQIAASIGVIIGLIFVAYEVRQNNTYAEAAALRSNYSGWEQISISEFETDIAYIYVKSIEDPDNLSSAEMFKLSAWLTAIVNLYDRALTMSDLGLGEYTTDDLSHWSAYYFGSPFGKAWLDANEVWINPRNFEAIMRGLESNPNDTDYWNRESLREALDGLAISE